VADFGQRVKGVLAAGVRTQVRGLALLEALALGEGVLHFAGGAVELIPADLLCCELPHIYLFMQPQP
jgi:hypothetical protein